MSKLSSVVKANTVITNPVVPSSAHARSRQCLVADRACWSPGARAALLVTRCCSRPGCAAAARFAERRSVSSDGSWIGTFVDGERSFVDRLLDGVAASANGFSVTAPKALAYRDYCRAPARGCSTPRDALYKHEHVHRDAGPSADELDQDARQRSRRTGRAGCASFASGSTHHFHVVASELVGDRAPLPRIDPARHRVRYGGSPAVPRHHDRRAHNLGRFGSSRLLVAACGLDC